MGRVVLRSEVATRIRRHAGQENVGLSANRLFVDPTELNELIDDGFRELDCLLAEARGHDYAAKTAPLTTMTVVDGQTGFDLPVDFFELLSVRLVESGTWRELERYHPSQVAALRNSASRGTFSALRYRIGGSAPDDVDQNARERIVVEPVPTTAPTLEVDYVPQLIVMASGDAKFQGVNGWESYVVYSVVADVLAKGEEDPSYWMAKKEAVKQRIARLRDGRDQSKPTNIILKPFGRIRGRGFSVPP